MYSSRTFKTLILSSGNALAKISGIIITALLARMLTTGEYASYRQTLLVFSLSSPILQLGLPNALYYFLPAAKEKGKKYLTANLVLLLISALVFILFINFGGNRIIANNFDNPDLSGLLVLYSPYALFSLPVLSLGATLISRNKVRLLTIFNILSKLVVMISVIGLVYFWVPTSKSGILGNVIASFIVLLPAIYLMYKSVPGKKWLPSRSIFFEQVKYSVPLGLATMMGSITRNLDKAVVASMTSSEEFAIYTNGAMEIPFIGILTGSVASILIPDFVKFFNDNKLDKLIGLWRNAVIKVSLLIFPLVVFLFFTAPQVIKFLYSDKYIQAVIPFRIYLLILPIRIATYGSLFMSSGKNHLILIRSVVEIILNILLTIILVNFFGYIGAASAVIIVLYLFSLPFNLFHIRKILNTDYSSVMPFSIIGQIFLLSLIPSVVFIVNYWIHDLPALLILTIYATLYFSGYLLIIQMTNVKKYFDLSYYLNLITSRK